jgi:phosphatidylglycerol:prolipoprotein diacylglycerol transferase
VIHKSFKMNGPLRWTMQLAAPALAAAYALGRIGCCRVNDDYGRPSDLPWAVGVPRGLPPSTAGTREQRFGVPVAPGNDPSPVLAVHPTQLYEAILLLAAFMLLWSLRQRGRPIGWIFGLYLVLAGAERFLIEFLRAKDDRFLGPFTLAQLTSVLLIGFGVWLAMRLRQGADPGPGAYLSTGRRAG